ncbi:MAG: HDOD domain-containing protein [Propionivibrio sp.]
MDVSAVLSAIAADAERGDIVFPTHTEIALRIGRLLDDPDCAIDALGKLIAAEPILAARVIGLANSVSHNPGGHPVTELRSAISRLGFSALRALAAAVVVRQMQEMSTDESHRALAGRLWEHTAGVAALARVIARRVTRQNPDAAFFAGIVHEVGSFYLIARAAVFPGLLDGELDPWPGDAEAQVGRAVLRALEVPAHILEALETMWSGYLAMPPRSLGDTLLLADRLSPVESPLDALDGMSRRGMAVELELLLDDETLSGILAESAAEVASISAALKA